MKRDNQIEEMASVILLNNNYNDIGLKEGFVGTVVESFVDKLGIVLVDFSNPFTGETIRSNVEIKKGDFRIATSSMADQKAIKRYRNLFK